MKYCFDLDETICLTPASRIYDESIPYDKVISFINGLYDSGHEITIFTARGSTSEIDYTELTKSQLKSWGLKYHRLILKKPSYDCIVDDKAINSIDWRKSNDIRLVGFVASCFDLLHSGHCLYLKEAKKVCDHLIAGLHVDPSIERPSKNKPIQSLDERLIQLQSNRNVDEIVIYHTEEELKNILCKIKPDIRILGSDCKKKPITGEEWCKQIYYHDRNHDRSSSELRKRIQNDGK